MTEKENAMRAFKRQNPQWLPNTRKSVDFLFPEGVRERGDHAKEWFGVYWEENMVPPGTQFLESMEDWEKIKFPDFSVMDWEKLAEKDLKKVDRENKVLCVMLLVGPFERMHALMPFEEALVSFYDYPEETAKYLKKYEEKRLELIGYIGKYYKPDVIYLHDDYGNKSDMFFSPDIWREYFKESLCRYVDKIHEQGALAALHCCGKVERILNDFVECKVDIWDSVQPCNDLERIGREYGDKIAFSAGMDQQGALAVSGCTEEEAREEVRRTIRMLGTANGTDSPQQKAAETMDELLAERLPQYRLEIYPNGQLGNERDLIESIQLGTLDLTVTATTPLVSFVPSLGAGELLYLIQSNEHADAVYQGEIGAQWLKDCEAAGIKGLGFAEVGFRQYCNTKKPIESLEDLQGQKLRVMENEMHVEGWKKLGVDAITMGWSDAYAGLQQGTIDAVENPWCLIYANKVYEVSKYIAETNHIYTAQCFMMSQQAWNKLSEEEQEIWQECATEACQEAIRYNRDSIEEFKQTCVDQGCEITTPDMTEAKEMSKALYEQYDAQYGDTIRKIQELAQ